MIKNIIWDFDGTLIDTYPQILECYKRLIKNNHIDITIEEVFKILKANSSIETLEHLSNLCNKTPLELREEYTIYSKEEDVLKTASAMSYSIELCEFIKSNGLKNYIVTNRDDTALYILKYLDMEKYFDGIYYYGVDDITIRKPDSRTYGYVVDKYNLTPSETLSIGDRDIDVITSGKINLVTCLLNTGSKYISNPDYVVDSLKSVEKIIKML